MPFIYPSPHTLIGTPKVGTTDCVALVQFYAGLPDHRLWKAGTQVLDNPKIQPGTAIATFVNGRYPSNDTGNHAAFFLRHDAPGVGFWVVDQWKDKEGQRVRPVSRRLISARRLKQNADGTWPYASDNADAFSVIELR